MGEKKAFSIHLSGEEASELKKNISETFKEKGIQFDINTSFQYDGPPEGSFGFGDGFLSFIGEAWKELVKIPGAVVAIAEGFRDYLKNRPNSVIKIVNADGSTILIRGNMDGNSIAKAMKNISNGKNG